MMQTEKIVFSNRRQALAVSVTRQEETPQAIEALKLPAPRPVIVWIGGAGSMQTRFGEPVSKIARIVAQIAQEARAIMIDGATASGVMAVVGEVYFQGGYEFPLVGVVAKQLVSWSNVPQKPRTDLMRKIRLAVTSMLVGSAGIPWPLDPHHTHFFLVPGNWWGVESAWISHIATQLAGDCPSITVLSNGRPGGGICTQDVEYSLGANRPVLVMQGTGGWADELANRPSTTDLWEVVAADDEQDIREIVFAYLKR